MLFLSICTLELVFRYFSHAHVYSTDEQRMRRTIHYVLKIGDRRAAINFYTRLLGMQVCV
jgi:hypothetical protein